MMRNSYISGQVQNPINPLNPRKKQVDERNNFFPSKPSAELPIRYHSGCNILTATTVVGCQLPCLWVPPRITGRHTRSGYRLLRNSQEVLVPAKFSLLSPSSLCFCCPSITVHMISCVSTLSCCMHSTSLSASSVALRYSSDCITLFVLFT